MTEVVSEYASGTLSQTDSIIFLQSMASAVEFTIQDYHSSHEEIQLIVGDVTDYIIYNWRPAGLAINQLKHKFFAAYLATKDAYTEAYVGLLVIKCVLALALALLIVGLNWRRIWRRAEILNYLLGLSNVDAKNALLEIEVFTSHLSGTHLVKPNAH